MLTIRSERSRARVLDVVIALRVVDDTRHVNACRSPVDRFCKVAPTAARRSLSTTSIRKPMDRRCANRWISRKRQLTNSSVVHSRTAATQSCQRRADWPPPLGRRPHPLPSAAKSLHTDSYDEGGCARPMVIADPCTSAIVML